MSKERDECTDLVKREEGGTLRLESRRERWIERGGEGELGSCERGRTRFLVFRSEGRFRVGLNARDEHGARNCPLMPNTQTHSHMHSLLCWVMEEG